MRRGHSRLLCVCHSRCVCFAGLLGVGADCTAAGAVPSVQIEGMTGPEGRLPAARLLAGCTLDVDIDGYPHSSFSLHHSPTNHHNLLVLIPLSTTARISLCLALVLLLLDMPYRRMLVQIRMQQTPTSTPRERLR